MILTAHNPSTDNLEKSYLANDYSVGVTSIVVRNTDRFSEDDRIMLGEMGAENAEIVTVSAVNADDVTLTVGATSFPHSASEPVYVLKYDQIKFYRSTTTIDGSYSALVTVNIDVDNTDNKTRYDDTTGVSSYFYKIAFYNSVSLVESSLSDPMPGSGYSRKQVGTLINDFLVEVGDIEQEYITVPQILSLLNECNEDIIGQSRRPYRFLRKSELKTITADDDRIALPTDIVRLDRVKYTRDDGATDETKGNLPIISTQEMEYLQYQENSVASTVGVGINVISVDETDNEIVIYPKPTTTQANALKVYYWGEFDVFTSLADLVQTPVARIYKLFLLGRFYRMRAKKDDSFLAMSDRYLNDYTTEIVKLQRAQKVDIGTPMSFQPDTRNRFGLRRSV